MKNTHVFHMWNWNNHMWFTYDSHVNWNTCKNPHVKHMWIICESYVNCSNSTCEPHVFHMWVFTCVFFVRVKATNLSENSHWFCQRNGNYDTSYRVIPGQGEITLVSSSTVLRFSTHTVSTGPSSTIQNQALASCLYGGFESEDDADLVWGLSSSSVKKCWALKLVQYFTSFT